MENSDVNIYGLLGRNINYSLSPVMHNAAFEHYGIPSKYTIFDKEENELEAFLEKEVLGGKIKGFNVTVPYKIKVREFLESKGFELHNWVKITGALNTVVVEDGTFKGYNTDVSGFLSSVQQDLDVQVGPERKYKMFIAGAGGAGRAIALYMASKLEKVYVYDVSHESLDVLQNMSNEEGTSYFERISIVRDEDSLRAAISDADIIVNATPLGTREGGPSPVPLDCLRNGHMVYDLVYARETDLLKEAKEKGLKCANGLGMLINQAAKAFEKWTGKPFDEVKDIMREAADKELQKRG